MLRSFGALLGLAFAQTVLIENAEELSGTATIRILRGGVVLRQDTIQLFCEEAEVHEGGYFAARGATRTLIGQSGHITAQQLHYDPLQRKLTYTGHVTAQFGSATLRTQHLFYERATETAYYEGGGTLTDTSGTIRSTWAAYHVPTQTAHFSGQVRIEKTPYLAYTDTLWYEVDSSLAVFPKAFAVYNQSEPETLKAQAGQWDRLRGHIHLHSQAEWRSTQAALFSNYAFYDQGADTGYAACEVRYLSRTGRGWGIADSAFWKADTLRLQANVAAFLFSPQDTAFVQAETALLTGAQVRLLQQATLLRPPLSAMADTLSYDTLAHIAELSGHAWLQSHPYQLFAEYVRLHFHEETPESLYAVGQVRVVSEADSFLRFYHQVCSENAQAAWDTLIGAFSPLHFSGKVLAIYYQAEGPHWQGAHEILEAGALYLEMGADRQPRYLRLEEQPRGRFIPIRLLLQKPLFMRPFAWRPAAEQPRWPIHSGY